MKVLFLPNWKVHPLAEDSAEYQAPDKLIAGKPYWFFKYFPADWQIDVLDFKQPNPLSWLEKKANIYIWQAILALFKSRQYDFVISHGAQSGLMLALLRRFFPHKSLHIIFDIGGMNGGRKNVIENAIIKFALGSKPHIVCHSTVIIENYRGIYDDLVARSRFIPFGVDTDDFLPDQTNAENSNPENVNNKQPYVLAFGSAKRDYETLLKAWQQIDFPLHIVGAKGLKPQKNVQLIAKVGIAELKQQIAGALFVVIPLPVFKYSYGQMSFLQSMSMGKTAVVTHTPSSVDYIQEGRGAFFVKPYHSQDLQAKVQHLLNFKHELEASNQAARQYVVDYFSERMMAERLYEHLNQLAKQAQGTS